MTDAIWVRIIETTLPLLASAARAVYTALFGQATVDSMLARARGALAHAGGTRAAMEAIFAVPPQAAKVAREMPQVSEHTSDRIRCLASSVALTAEDREACAKGAAFIAAIVSSTQTLPAAPVASGETEGEG